jgi:hypothetical protein
MRGGQHPLGRDDRAAAKADLVVHRAVNADLPGILAFIGRMAPDDHLVIVGGKSRGVNSTSERGKQKKFRYNYIDSRHSISPETGFIVACGLP